MQPGDMILFSASPRRSELLSRLGIKFEVFPLDDIDETADSSISAPAAVELIALRKLSGGMGRHPGAAHYWGLAADTMVEGYSGLLGKPGDALSACEMIRELSGTVHQVHSAFAVCAPSCSGERLIRSSVHTARVRFRNLSEREIQWYVGTDEWMGAAGGYRIQERGEVLVESIDGLWSTVVGLPLSPLYGILSAMNYPLG
jgi:septum formation protein